MYRERALLIVQHEDMTLCPSSDIASVIMTDHSEKATINNKNIVPYKGNTISGRWAVL